MQRVRASFLRAMVVAGGLAWTAPCLADAFDLPYWLRVSGDLRVRLEVFDNEDFNDHAHDAIPYAFGRRVMAENDEWILTRARLRLDARPSDWFRAFVELTDARLFEDEDHRDEYPGTRGNWETDSLDVFQGYVDVRPAPGAHVLLGRQVLHYGAGRVLAEYDWWNAPYSFDAARLQLRRPGWDLDLFIAQNAVNDDGNFNDTDDSRSSTRDDYTLHGAYFVYHGWNYTSLDLYLIHFDNHNADMRVPNLGARLHGTLGEAWDYDLEAIFQPWGEVSGRDLSAWSAASRLGYTFYQCSLAPRFFVGYDYATGDSDPRDDEAEGFFTLYADNYSLFGNQEFVTRRNLHAALAGAQSRLWRRLASGLSFRSFWVDEDDDQWYGMYHTYAAARRGRSADNHMGGELDVYLTWPIPVAGRDVHTLLRYSRFFPGQFIEDVHGAADDAQEAVLMFQCFF